MEMRNLIISVIAIMGLLSFATGAYALPTQVIDLGDETIEQVQIGYSQNAYLENLEYWFAQNGITNTDGSAINPVANQLQHEFFYTDTTRSYEVEFLGIGYASYHSEFGVFTYSGNPFEDFDSTYITYQDPLFVQNEVADNSVYSFDIEADTYFGFYLNSNGKGKYLTTLVANNPAATSKHVEDKESYKLGLDHALFFETNKGYTISFEDIVGGGDADYEDLVVNFSPSDGSSFIPQQPASTPEPATMLLLGSGMLGLAGFRRKFIRKNS
jgi:hypothetical protein